MDRLQYNNKALVGNWYEDRLDASKAPMPELERTGKYRVTPLKMIETTPDLYVTTNQAYFTPQIPIVPPPPAQFISKDTLATALHDRVPPEGSRPYGFGSTLPRHIPGHDSRQFETTTHSTYGGKYADDEEKRKEIDPNLQEKLQAKPAGKVFHNNAAVGIRTGGSTDERLQLGESDPKCHSFVQRSWLGHTGHQNYILNSDSYKATLNRTQNIPGLALHGLGEQDAIDRNVDPNKKFYRKNDTIRRDVGIWNEH